MRLPHLTLTQRTALDFEVLAANPSPNQSEIDFLESAQGLTIFNTTSQCIEYWDSREWISMCTSSASFFLKSVPPIPAEGGSTPLIKPEGGGGCTQNPPYTVAIVAGIDYVTNPNIVTDATTGEFQVEFYPNPTAVPRYVIVRVTDNCTNLYRDLSIQQLANTALCESPSAIVPIINSKSGGAGIDDAMCSGGEVPLWLTNTNSSYTYIWTLNGLEIQGATGTTYVATKGGSYGVVVGAMGCINGAGVTKKIVEDRNNQAGTVPLITATNGGIMCGGGIVVLRAYNGTTPLAVDWYKDGVLRTSNTTTLSVSTSNDAGLWTAIASTACGSKRSNTLVVEFDGTTPNGLNPLVLTIDGTPISSTPVICAGGSMTLEITNAADYASLNPIYTWFVGEAKILEGPSPKVVLSVPNTSSLTLDVQLRTSGYCPLSKDYSAVINPLELTKPRLNEGRTEAFICGTSQAVRLTADVADGVSYEWIRNGAVKEITSGPTVDYTEVGSYQVRYKKNNCWSALSNPIELKNQAYLNLNWDNGIPPGDEAVGTVMTIGVYTSPPALQYTWISDNPAIIKVTPLSSDNRFATIEYLASGTAKIAVRATNECGYRELAVTLNSGATACSPIANLNFTANPTTATSGTTLTYGVGYTGGSATVADHKFDWVVKDELGAEIHTSNLSGASGKTFSYTFATQGKYTVEVTAYDVCQIDPLTRMKIAQAVTINPDVTTIPVAPGKYSMTGLMCYDIAKSGLGMPRTYSFLDASGNEKYKFEYKLLGTPMTIINVFTEGIAANTLLDGAPTLNGTTITLSFSKSGVNSVDANGMSFTLVTLFSDGTNQYKIEKKITVQDKSCCGAATIGGGWLNFMCHNLGADENLPPFTHNVGLYGDFYQWGRVADGHEKRNSAVSAGIATAAMLDPNTGQILASSAKYGKFITNSSNTYDWRDPQVHTLWGNGTQDANPAKTQVDPCPAGWKVPSQKQWASIYSTMTTPNEWKWTGNGYMVGASLYLPIPGYRNYTGVITDVGKYATYWSSTRNMISNGQYSYSPLIYSGTVRMDSYRERALGGSVRCVAE